MCSEDAFEIVPARWPVKHDVGFLRHVSQPYRRLRCDEDAEIDPTQKAARTEGRSPASILVTTFSDELRSANGGQSKVFGVSVKDRGAVSLAGHSGKAFWFSKASGQFVTTNYYYDEYPQWVKEWNSQKLPQKYAETTWSLLHEPASYIFADTDDRPWELDLGGFGRIFPHAYEQATANTIPPC